MQNMTQNRLTVNRRVLWTRGEIGGDEIDRVVSMCAKKERRINMMPNMTINNYFMAKSSRQAVHNLSLRKK